MVLAVLAFAAATCSADDNVEACPPLPEPGSEDAQLLEQTRSQAQFPLKFPCYLPNSQELESAAVTGEPGRQRAELVWSGPFDMTIRQSQYRPAVSPDPTGSTRTTLNLYPNVQAALVEQNDASGDALYHLFWQQDDIYYEIQAFGPPTERDAILDIATSLQYDAGQQTEGNDDQGAAE